MIMRLLLLALLLPAPLLAAPRLSVRVDVDAAAFAGAPDDHDDDVRLRRLRVSLRRTRGDLRYRTDTDFADGEPEYKNIWIGTRWRDLVLTAGSFRTPISHTYSAPARFLSFPERPMVTALLPRRRLGLGLSGARDGWGWATALFGTDLGDVIEDDLPIASRGVAMRLVRGIRRADDVLHLGLGLAVWRADPRGDGIDGGTETKADIPDLVDTGALAGAGRRRTLAAEAVWIRRGLTLQGELLFGGVPTDAGDPLFTAQYIQATWTPGGQRREYRLDPWSPGVVRDLDAPRGAWELAARLSRLDLDDADGGRARQLSLGVNWHPGARSLVMLHHAFVDGGGRSYGLWQSRLMIVF